MSLKLRRLVILDLLNAMPVAMCSSVFRNRAWECHIFVYD